MVKGTYQSTQRMSRVHELLDAVRQCNVDEKAANRDKLVCAFAFDWGIRDKTVEEYVDFLIKAGKINESEGFLYPSSSSSS